MAFTRNIDFKDKEIYDELQRLSNLYTNGNKSEFVRKSILQWGSSTENLQAALSSDTIDTIGKLEKDLQKAIKDMDKLKKVIQRSEEMTTRLKNQLNDGD